jgi:ribonuclease BN (tRNA processing enzyme)
VKTLVLSHFVPENHPDGDRAWLQAARSHFGGEVILGKDLLEL